MSEGRNYLSVLCGDEGIEEESTGDSENKNL